MLILPMLANGLATLRRQVGKVNKIRGMKCFRLTIKSKSAEYDNDVMHIGRLKRQSCLGE
ncbi:hypothetical protein [Bacteroides helcogenes]|uniref:hypothetical protein n=1 Tax=Bacteroides helcogenes TaxID=290053 RepID=UPI00059FE5F4|nr:hypothetical protein [Bacteroides helcogenes]